MFESQVLLAQVSHSLHSLVAWLLTIIPVIIKIIKTLIWLWRNQRQSRGEKKRKSDPHPDQLDPVKQFDPLISESPRSCQFYKNDGWKILTERINIDYDSTSSIAVCILGSTISIQIKLSFPRLPVWLVLELCWSSEEIFLHLMLQRTH